MTIIWGRTLMPFNMYLIEVCVSVVVCTPRSPQGLRVSPCLLEWTKQTWRAVKTVRVEVSSLRAGDSHHNLHIRPEPLQSNSEYYHEWIPSPVTIGHVEATPPHPQTAWPCEVSGTPRSAPKPVLRRGNVEELTEVACPRLHALPCAWERQTERERDGERETDRQTDRQTD